MFAAIAYNTLRVIHSSSISNENKWAEKPKLKYRPTKWRTWTKIEASISASAHVWTLFVNNFSHGCQLPRKAWYCSFNCHHFISYEKPSLQVKRQLHILFRNWLFHRDGGCFKCLLSTRISLHMTIYWKFSENYIPFGVIIQHQIRNK